MNFLATIKTDKDRIKLLYRVVELLRLKHNEKGKDFREGRMTEKDFRNYQRNDFEPRNERLYSEINILKEKLDLTRDYSEIKGEFSPNIKESQRLFEEGVKSIEFDKYIDLKKI